MARPQKKGLDYFPLDVMMDRADDDIEILEAKYGASGFATLIKLYMKIYQDEGYFIKWNEKPSLLLAKRVNVDINLVKGVINDLLEWDIFSKKMYKDYHILTSKRIQSTYMEAVKKRKNVEMIESLLLIETVNSNINLVNSDIYPQSKVKKSKVNESKEEKDDCFFENETLNNLFKSFLKQRKKLKAINSDLAINTIINKLNKFDDDIKIQMINNAIESSWKTVYEIKNGYTKETPTLDIDDF